MNYYNEIDKFAANWLRELIKAKLIPNGKVDERSITDVKPSDLKGYVQCHFFAGIGGWAYALRLAGWPDDRPVWTGSCPCQPFSVAGKGEGIDDERHLWPAFRWLIAQRRPATVFGEQVASKDGRLWLAGVRSDLEAMGYAVGAADMCAAGVGAPHIRQRLFWVAESNGERLFSTGPRVKGKPPKPVTECSADGRLGKSNSTRPQPGHKTAKAARQGNPVEPTSFWSNSIPIPCAGGKWRRVPGRVAENQLEIEPILFPLADGLSNRVGALRGAGNAINPFVAKEFIQSFMEVQYA